MWHSTGQTQLYKILQTTTETTCVHWTCLIHVVSLVGVTQVQWITNLTVLISVDVVRVLSKL